MLKVRPHPDYPPEEGRYLRGNDASPVAVAVVLNCDADKIPPDLENLLRAAAEAGAALAGTVQTENIGLEKIVLTSLLIPTSGTSWWLDPSRKVISQARPSSS